MSASPIRTLNVRLPAEIVEWVDLLVSKGIYKNRSEAIRSFARQYLRERNSE